MRSRPAQSRLGEWIDREDRIPEAVVHGLAEEGFLGLSTPSEWDGTEGDARSIVAVWKSSPGRALPPGRSPPSISPSAPPRSFPGERNAKVSGSSGCSPEGARLGAFAPTKPGAGSDTARLTTRYSRDEGGFSLRGTKTFISNAVSAGIVLVFATSDPAPGHKGISAFIVPPGTSGFSVAQRFEKLGLRGSETAEIVLDDVRLPRDSLLGPEGGGLRVALGALQGGRVGIASCALGVAETAFLEMQRAVAADDAEWKRTLLAQAFAELSAARALVARAAEAKDAEAPYVIEASVAKLVASRAAFRIASAGVDVAGAGGARADVPAQRLLRDARVFPIVEGTTEIQELILARSLLPSPSARNPL